MAEPQDPDPDGERPSSDRPRRTQMSRAERRRRRRRGPRHAARGRRDRADGTEAAGGTGPDPVPAPAADVGPVEAGGPGEAAEVAAGRGPGAAGEAPGRLPPVRRARRGVWILAAAVVLAAGLVIAFLAGWLDRAIDLVSPADDPAIIAEGDAASMSSAVIVTYDADDPSGAAARIVVLSHDAATGQGTVLLVPTATVADVPGYGAFSLGEAHTFGGPGLVDVSLANLLGVRFDAAVGMSDTALRELFEDVGPIEVELRAQQRGTLPDGTEVSLDAGPQRLGAAAATDLLHVRFPVETELESMPRVAQVVRGLLEAVGDTAPTGDLGLTEASVDVGPAASRPPSADDEADTTGSDGAPSPVERVRELIVALAAAQSDDAVTVVTLPVATLGTGREDSYRLDAARAETLVGDRFTALRPQQGPGVGASVQVLNGNGIPAIGQRVAERLSDGGYRIVLTDNADRFDYERTRIVVYDAGDEAVAIARDVRERLGVGDIERSATPQSVVDVTIVVGLDFTG